MCIRDRVIDESKDNLVITTEDEISAFLVIKAIVREVIDVKRVVMRDAQSYCSILIDDNNRRPLCRLRFNYTQKYLGLIDENKNEIKVALITLDDIYQHADKLRATAAAYASSK